MPTRNGVDPQTALKISEKSRWWRQRKSVKVRCRERERLNRHWVSMGFHRRIWGRWRAALIMFNSCFYWPCHWRKLLLHTGWESSHGRERLYTQQTGTVNEKYYKTGSAATPRLHLLHFFCLLLLTKQLKWENKQMLNTFALFWGGQNNRNTLNIMGTE